MITLKIEKKLNIYFLALPGLSYGRWDLIPCQAANLGLGTLGAQSLATGPPGKPLDDYF